MFKEERQKNLVDLLTSSQAMSVYDLSKELNSSMMTIRRDLEDLELKGVIKKLHGGAVLVKEDMIQPPFEERINESGIEKQAIGKAACGLIRNGDIVFFDAGTTTLAAAQSVPDDLEFTAITTGLMTAIVLCGKPRVNVIHIGGCIHHTSYSSTNQMSVEMIRRFNANMAFISTKAVSFPEGTFESLLELIEVKQAMVSVSEKVILLADHNKFVTKSLCLAIPMDKIHLLITDSQTSEEVLGKIRETGVHIMKV
jgi:DeoR/GlpR family transcriptional regulator of sugar metabolism